MKMPSFRKKTTVTKNVRPVVGSGPRVIPSGPVQDVIVESDGVIKIGKVKYAVNLVRKVVTDVTPKEEAKIMKPVGAASTWNLYAKIADNKTAFGSSDIGHSRGMPLLAESINTQLLGENWIVVIALSPEKFWITEMKNGSIVSDEIFDDARLARDEIYDERSTDIRPIVAPANWEIPDAINAQIYDIISKEGPKLQKFGFIANNLGRILLVSLVLLAASGAYYQFKVVKDRQIALEREMAEKRKNRVLVADKDYPWFAQVRPEKFMETCSSMMNGSIKMVAGWEPQATVCQYATGTAALTQVYMREETGRIAWLRDVYVSNEGNVGLDETGNVATYTVSQPLETDGKDFKSIKPWTGENIQRVLVERFQNVGLRPTISSKVSKAPPQAAKEGEKPTFNYHTLKITLPGYPDDVARLMADIPAAVPTSLIWDRRSGEWTIEVKVYHPAILPLGAI